jgi:hypothetical protein
MNSGCCKGFIVVVGCETCGTMGVDVYGLTGEPAGLEPDWGISGFCGPPEYAIGTNKIKDKIKLNAAMK